MLKVQHEELLKDLEGHVRRMLEFLELDFEPLPEDERPALSADPTGRLRARLPFGWMVDVWGRGLETIWGRFCLSAATSDGVHWELLTVGPDLADPAVIRVELPALPEPPGRP